MVSYPMRFRSLKSKLMLAVFGLVIGTGLFTSLLVTQRYGKSLFSTMRADAQNLAHTVALEAADKILINDLVALQKMFDHHMRTNPAIGYLFVYRDGQILAHTFGNHIPSELISANGPGAEGKFHFQKIASERGERYLDIAWPILKGRAGILRFGFSERPYRRQMARLWIQMSVLTLGILLLALSGTLLFVRRIARPLAALAKATERVDRGEQNVRVEVEGHDEVATLAASFNRMVASMEEYTRKLEEQTMELDRAHHQTRTSCGIVLEIGSLRTLNEIGYFLLTKLQDILKCSETALLIFNGHHDLLFVLSVKGVEVQKEPEILQAVWSAIKGVERATFTSKALFKPPLVPGGLEAAGRQAIVPIRHENRPFGALVIGCGGDCLCDKEELDIVGLILAQAAGAIKRTVMQEEEFRDVQHRMETRSEFGGIIGRDPRMRMIYKLIEDIAPTDVTVLIQGESGTGKELVARAIHQMSPRRDRPFIVINCSAYPATLLESELFGHEKGAFTGAIRKKAGRFEQADGGTIFLDEVGEIPPSAQIKLLRALQSRKFERLGGEETLSVDVRLLAATNKDLLQEVKDARFREDLFYRLNVILINLPPLRERRNDIPLLAQHFLRLFATEQGRGIEEFSPEAMRLLLDYSWPGNVRELENSIEHATVLAKGRQMIVPSDLPQILFASSPHMEGRDMPLLAEQEKRFLDEMAEKEKRLLEQVLEECGWNKKQASKRLGISRSTLYEKLKRHQISRPSTH